MSPESALNGWSALRIFALALCAGALIAHAANVNAASPETLRAQYDALQGRLSDNPFRRPLILDSSETSGGVAGEIYALIHHPFATVSTELNRADRWCDILILHPNTKYCRASTAAQGHILDVSIGKKYDQPLDEAHRVTFAYRVIAQTANHLQVILTADEGPLSTRNYRIVLEAVPLENGRTFIHLSYAYDFGLVGRLAMQAYLGTIGKSKVGFTVVSTAPGGKPVYIGGMRGLVERNTMRYYLAIEALLSALSAPPQARMDKSLRDWFSASERYPRQLHELEQNQYLDMKRREYQRQQAAPQLKTQG